MIEIGSFLENEPILLRGVVLGDEGVELARGGEVEILAGGAVLVKEEAELGAELGVDVPDHLEEGPGHGEHRAAFRSIRSRGEDAGKLPFQCPPVVNDQRMINQDDRICRVKARFNQIKWSPSINYPVFLRENVIMLSFDFLVRSSVPAGLPLDPVNWKQWHIQSLAQFSAQS